MQKILEVNNLKVYFKLKTGIFRRKKMVYAVDDVSFDVFEGEILGIVGESGCGKSSLARSLIGLNKIYSGNVLFDGKYNLANANHKTWHQIRKEIQFIFQDPVASLDPRMTVFEIISEPLRVYYPNLKEAEIEAKVINMMQMVGLTSNQMNRYSQEFSGGQCQRIGIARALILNPKLVICDESVSALDVSIKAQIINLLKELQQKLNLTIIFISHDLSIVKYVCDRVMVMYLGNVMEIANSKTIFDKHYHPYTEALLSSVPIADPIEEKNKVVKLLEGEIPSPINPPKGCVFNTRCPIATNECTQTRPQLKVIDGAVVRCIKV
jgi:oligopeptide transport system ATP-binding protein